MALQAKHHAKNVPGHSVYLLDTTTAVGLHTLQLIGQR